MKLHVAFLLLWHDFQVAEAALKGQRATRARKSLLMPSSSKGKSSKSKLSRSMMNETLEPGQLGVCESTTCSFRQTVNENDTTTRVGLGESAGVPNLEYLGSGYDILRGNPRGSSSLELDPGFRGRIFSLLLDQTVLSNDQVFTVPIGTDLKYVHSCRYDSESTEVSSQRDFQEQLSKESSKQYSVGASGTFPLKALFISLDAQVSWSKSEKFESFVSTSRSTNRVTFESLAMCTEFDASFKPFFDKTEILDPTFVETLANLPSNYDGGEEHKAAYEAFIQAYGTHYVDRVVLGGKRVLSTSLLTTDVLELTRENVDVRTTLSVDVQFALGSPKYVKDTLGNDPPPSPCCCKEGGGGEGDNEGDDAPAVGGSASFGTEQFAANSRQFEDIQKISTRDYRVSEVVIGGNPPVDENWKTWAASISDRPMPISYELKGLWELMTEQQQRDFYNAVLDIEGIDLLADEEPNPLLDALHFGVFGPQGDPISSYSVIPSSSYRALLRLRIIDKVDSEAKALDVFDSSRFDFEFDETTYKRADRGFFACGARARYDAFTSGGDDDEGITEIYLVYCDIEDWDSQTEPERISPQSSEGESPGKLEFCSRGKYITGARVRYCDNSGPADRACDGGDQLGVYALEIRCVDKRGEGQEDVIVSCDASDTENNDCESLWQEWVLIPREEGQNENERNFIDGGTVQFGFSNRRRLQEDAQGHRLLQGDTAVEGLRFFHSIAVTSQPLSDVYTYSVVWDDSRNTPTPLFVQMIRGGLAPSVLWDKDFGVLEKSLGSGKYSGNLFNIENSVPFALGKNRTMAEFGITNFKSDIDPDDLRSFCFLTADNLPAEDGFVSGMVHPGGYALNIPFGSADTAFTIEETGDRRYQITFEESMDEPPTLIAFPLWISGENDNLPTNYGDIALSALPCTRESCEVQFTPSAEGPELAYKYAGFNFLAIDGSIDDNAGIAHGRVNVAPTVSADEAHGFSVESDFDAAATEEDIKFGREFRLTGRLSGRKGGVIITFDVPFRDIPSVIATPITEETFEYRSADVLKAPFCIVEHLTRKQAYIKCGVVDSLIAGETNGILNLPDSDPFTIQEVDFYVVAVGPPAETP